MSGPEHPDRPDASDHDEDEFEVSSIRSGAGSPSSSSWAALFAADPLARRHRRRIAIAVATGLLALAVSVSTFAGVRGALLGFLKLPAPTPTVSILAGQDLFYLLPNPPGVVVTLDGHALTRQPAPGDPSPLRLARGRHVFAWTSNLFPFEPQSCIMFVPLSPADTCPFLAQHDLPASMTPLAGHVIALHESLATLPSDQGDQLTQAIRSALAAAQSVATVQAGERYFSYTPGSGTGGGPVRATQPLRASLSFQFDQQTGAFEPCFATGSGIPCRFPGQDCTQLCTVAEPPVSLGLGVAPNVWVAAATVSDSWGYTTLGGRVIASNLSDAYALQLAVFSIFWDGASWQVSPLFFHVPGLPVADDAVCDPARFLLSQNGTWSFVMTNPPGGAQPQFASDATPTDGCLAVWNNGGASAVFLERFGVLLAVNDVAAGSQSGLPRADAAEQRLARQIAAQAGIRI